VVDIMYSPPMLIGGEEARPTRERRVYPSPGTGAPTTEILLGNTQDVDAAVDAARRAAPELAALSLDARAQLCDETARDIEEHAEAIARIITRVHGKPLRSEAIGEVLGSAGGFRQAGQQARWLSVSHYPLATPEKRLLAVRRPRGVYGIVTPWNFPLGVALLYYLGPGLAAGNAIVWVGAPTTSAAHWAVAEIIARHWPKGALNLVTGDGPVIGQALVGHPRVDAVGFTGSTPVGYEVARAAAGKPLLLELGGNGPTIVLDDADVERAAARIAAGSFANAGQICTATGRILAHERVAAPLAEAIAAHARKLVLGDPEDERTTLGPVHLATQADRVIRQIRDATAAGAVVVTGGGRLEDAPTRQYLQPTVVDKVPADAPLHCEESFGPVAPIVRFGNDAEMWRLVEASNFGLFGAVFSRDVERAIGVAERLRCGHVNINDASSFWEISIPAGGAAGSASGIGRTGGPWSVAEMTEVFTMTVESGQGN
jgi:acyl-CoA reductase-like NAD-dependent aldehyde dehydrogenase